MVMTGWCRMYEEQLETWESLGGVPDDASTRAVAVDLLLALWRRHKAVCETLEQLASAPVQEALPDA